MAASTHSIYTATPEDLERLTSEEAVQVIASLLWSEAFRLQVGLNEISIPNATTTPDGGVDAEVKNSKGAVGLGIIKAGLTRYQIKTGTFSLAGKKDIKEIFLQPKSRKKRKLARNDLHPRVRTCLEQNGTLVVVLFGSDNPDPKDDKAPNSLKAFLSSIDSAFANASVEVWRQNQLIAFLQHFPALLLRIRGITPDVFAIPHSKWFDQGGFDGSFVQNHDTRSAIASIQNALLNPATKSIHVRFVGDAGIGKSRLIYEATNHDALRSLVVYAKDADKFLASSFYQQVVGDADKLNIILVTDECSPSARGDLRVRLRNFGANVRVVSIYNEEEEGDKSPEFQFFDAPRLDEERITEIIEQYGVPADDARYWAAQCDGSPRTAHVVGQNLQAHVDVLRGDGLVQIWDRYIAGSDDPKSDLVRRRRFSLCCLALFRRVGWKAEALEVYEKIVRPIEPAISIQEFISIVELARRRKVLQGEHALYITPKLLHVRLWRDWWSAYRELLPLMTLLPSLSGALADWFIDMLIYAKGSPATEAVAKELLGPGGMFYKWEWLNSTRGSDLFFNLAQVDPRAALRCLTHTLGQKTVDELRNFRDGRPQLVRALKRLAVHRDGFLDASRLLLLLAEAETESYSNNATGTFADLFTLGWGRAATSELPPENRLAVLLEALNSSSASRHTLALEAFDRALQTNYLQFDVEEFHGLEKLPPRWHPKTYGEIHKEYGRYWQALREALPRLQDELQVRAANILVNHARELFGIASIRNLIVRTLRDINSQGLLKAGAVLEAIVQIQHYDKKSYPSDVQKEIDDLSLELQGTGFSALLRRYVGLGLLEDKFDDQGNLTNSEVEKIKSLASQAIANPHLVQQELKWLVTDEAKDGYSFGAALAEQDTRLIFWPSIFSSWSSVGSKAHDFFIGGYLHGVFVRAPIQWEELIFSIANDSSVQRELPALIWRSGMSVRTSGLITKLMKAGAFPIERLRMFSYGGVVKQVTEEDFVEWVTSLLAAQSWEAAVTALELFDYRYSPADETENGKSMPVDLAFRVLTQPVLFTTQRTIRRDTMLDYHWGKVATKLLNRDLDMGIEIARLVLENVGNAGSLASIHRSELSKLLDEVTRQAPVEMWQVIAALIAPPADSRAFTIFQWLRGGQGFGDQDDRGALLLIPRAVIWEWIESDVDMRAPYLAHYCPQRIDRVGGNPSFALEFLERYGHLKKVRSAFSANYHTGAWWGPASSHLEVKRNQLREILAEESNSNVRDWVADEIAGLEQWIEKEKVREERERW